MARGTGSRKSKIIHGVIATLLAVPGLQVFADGTELAGVSDTGSVGRAMNSETLRGGQFKFSILGQVDSDEYEDIDNAPEAGQSERTSTSFQADIGLFGRLQLLTAVSGDNDKDIETAENQEENERSFGYRGATVAIKGKLLNHSMVQAALIPYVTHVMAYTPDALEKTSGRAESGAKAVLSLGDTDLGRLNIFGGIHYRDPIAYRSIQIGNTYQAGIGIDVPIAGLLTAGGYYQVQGGRYAVLPRDLATDVDPEDRTITSRLFGGGIKIHVAGFEASLFGQRFMSGHEMTLPHQNTFGAGISYTIGGAKSVVDGGRETIISDDRYKDSGDRQATVQETEATASQPAATPEWESNLQMQGNQLPAGSVNFDKEIQDGAKASLESEDPYKLQLMEIHAAEVEAEHAKEEERLANERARSRELDASYQAAHAERAEIRRELDDEGLEITAEEANWRGLED